MSHHVLFCVDHSKSMSRVDAPDSKGERVSRANAVRKHCTVVMKEMGTQITTEENKLRVTYLHFSDDTDVVFSKQSPEHAISAIGTITKAPQGGTDYTAGLKRVREAITSDQGFSFYIIVFLSDGRPGDMPLPAPHTNPATIRRRGKVFDSAFTHLESLTKRLGARLQFFGIGLGQEDMTYMERLVKVAEANGAQKAIFSHPSLTPTSAIRTLPRAPATYSEGNVAAVAVAMKAAEVVAAEREADNRRIRVLIEREKNDKREIMKDRHARAAKRQDLAQLYHERIIDVHNRYMSYLIPKSEMHVLMAPLLRGEREWEEFFSQHEANDEKALQRVEQTIRGLEKKILENTRAKAKALAKAKAEADMRALTQSGLAPPTLAEVFTCISRSISDSISEAGREEGPGRVLRQVTYDKLPLYPSDSPVLLRVKATEQEVAYEYHFHAKNFTPLLGLRLAKHPFSVGGQRLAYSALYSPSIKTSTIIAIVAKESKYEIRTTDRAKEADIAQLTALVNTQRLATELAEEFNGACVDLVTRVKFPDQVQIEKKIGNISFLPLRVFYLKAHKSDTHWRVMTAESYLEGTFEKFNGNNGYVKRKNIDILSDRIAAMPLDTRPTPLEIMGIEMDYLMTGMVAQAFSHFSFYRTSSNGKASALLVCDLQGVRYQYTDPTVHSMDGRYGRTDLGEKGFETFFETHRCNAICVGLGLTTNVQSTTTTTTAATTATTTTSSASLSTDDILVDKTEHLSMRMEERNIETVELRRAVKHGDKTDGRGGAVKYRHKTGTGEVVYVADGAVGVTAYKSGR